jgi:hypothetical protein
MNTTGNTDSWREIRGGLRPSLILAVGAVLMPLSPILALFDPLATVAWYVWAMALTITGAGLALSSARPWLSWFGMIPAGLFLLQAVMLMLVIYGLEPLSLGYHLLPLPRNLSLIALAAAERKNLAPWRRQFLTIAALVAGLKIVANNVLTLPENLLIMADITTLLIMGAALVAVAIGLRHRESEWAKRRLDEMESGIRFGGVVQSSGQ